MSAHFLCSVCRRNKEIRELYTNPPNEPEPTEEELEQMVAEQYANLPDWWEKETERERSKEECLRFGVILTRFRTRGTRVRHSK